MMKQLIQFVRSLYVDLFATRTNVREAIEYAYEVFRAETGGNPSACTTALHVVLNTISHRLESELSSLPDPYVVLGAFALAIHNTRVQYKTERSFDEFETVKQALDLLAEKVQFDLIELCGFSHGDIAEFYKHSGCLGGE